jgi:hypothetical protein
MNVFEQMRLIERYARLFRVSVSEAAIRVARLRIARATTRESHA